MYRILLMCLPGLLWAAPNVLLIMVDDLRPELGCYGADHVRSPQIDKLAANGRVYERAYCQQAVCNPSRTSMLTGLLPDSIGITSNHAHFRSKQPDIVTLPQHFKNHGYHAAAIGKIYHGVFPDGASRTKWDTMGDPESWSVPAIRFGPRYYYTEEGIRQAKDAFAKSYPKDSDWTQKLVFGPLTEAPDVPDNTLYDGKVADSAVAALGELKDKQFFLAVGFIKPHSPFVAPKKYWDLYDPAKIPVGHTPFPLNAPAFAGHGSHEMRRYTDQPRRGDLDARRIKHAYLACISYIDAQVGRVLDELERLGLADDTIVALVGDHGYHLGEHGLWGKTTNFELDTRVPLIIRAPGLEGKTPQLAELLDLYPTLCELAGLPRASHLEGISLKSQSRMVARSQYPRGKLMGYSTRSERYRDTVWKTADGQTVARERYDYQTDPDETRNLIAHLSFESEAAGPFKTLKTALGTWTTNSGTCLVDDKHAKTGKHCLQLVGSVTLELADSVATDGDLNFWAERWTRRTPFSFRIEKRVDGKWSEIYNGDKKVVVGRAFLSDVSIPLDDPKIEALRFSSTSPPKAGILIDDIEIAPAIPQRIQSVDFEPAVFPAIAGRTPKFGLLRIQVAGRLNPISVEGVTLSPGLNEIWISQRQVTFSNGYVYEVDGELPEPRPGIALRDAGDDGVSRYRIPGLVTTKAGTLIGVYDVRRRNGSDLPGDIDVGMSRSTDGGHSWEPMRIIMDQGDDPAWHYDGIGDPAVLVDANTGTIWVAATWSHGNRSWRGSGPGLEPEETGQLMLTRSDDDGKTWSAPINITKQVKRPEWCFLLQGPGAGITMADGTIVFAAQYQDPPEQNRLPHSTILYSKDHGKTWQIGTGAFDDTTEAQVAEIAPGVLMLNCRYNRGNHRVIMTTRDMGATWQEHHTSRGALIEPRSCMAGLLDAGPWLLFSNPDSVRAREHITIKFSPDRGETWTRKILLDSGRGAGYSCMSMIDDKTIGILYEGSQSQLTFQRVELPEVPLSLAPIFGDGMVLQRDRSIAIWGRGPVGDTIRIEDQSSTVGRDGNWRIELPAKSANSTPQDLVIRSSKASITLSDVLIGDVWICAGQSNMEWPLKTAESAMPHLRFRSPDGAWTTDPKGFSGVGYHFGANLPGHPIGLIDVSSGGTPTEAWIREAALPRELTAGNWLENPLLDEWCQTRAKSQLAGLTNDHRFKPGHMWRTRMAPLRGLSIAGALWYQGESNAQTPERVAQHGMLFPLMVKDWRAQWGQGFPILYVQLPAMDRPHWPAFRDQQRRFLEQLPNLGMAITLDTGLRNNVHPPDKRPIGERLARLAKDISDTGPLLQNLQPAGDEIIVHFDSELKSADGQPIRHFEVATDTGEFHLAVAKIVGEQVILRSDAVHVPHRVRYACKPFPNPPVNLVNTDGLPASPFTTDEKLAPPKAPSRPNILLIVGEDHGCELSCYGDPVIKTPHIDGLAAGGVLYENGYITQSVCSPSRSTIFTGLYPHQNGQLGLATHKYSWFRKWPTSYSLLKAAGYRTGLIGKTHVLPEGAVEDYVDFRFQKGSNFAKRKVADYAREAGKFFRQGDTPFFMTVNYPDAHWPLQGVVDGLPKTQVAESAVRPLPYVGGDNPRLRKIYQNYYDCMLRLDACVGQLLGELQASGKADNTLVIFVGDHGAQMARGKVTVYEGGVRVPFIARWPRKIDAGQRSKELVSTTDLLPTFLDVAGLAPRPELPGLSLLGDQTRDYLVTERNCDAARHTFPQRTIRDDRYKLIYSPIRDREDPSARYYLEHGASHWTGSLTEAELKDASAQTQAGYARWLNPPEYQLYDLQADPHEWTPINNPEVQTRLTAALKAWQRDTADPIANSAKLKLLMEENERTFKAGQKSPKGGWKYLDYLAPQTSQTIFERTEEHGYRIPSLLVTQAGSILAFSERRVGLHDHAENDIVLRRSSDGGFTWSEEIMAYEDGKNSINDPQTVQLENGRILLMFARFPHGRHARDAGWIKMADLGYDDPKANVLTFVCHSDDDGLTWSKPVDISRQVKPPELINVNSPGAMIQLSQGPHKGRVVAGLWGALPIMKDGKRSREFRNVVAYSDDNGVMWSRTGFLANEGPGFGNECQVAEASNGDLILVSRNQGGEALRKKSISRDGGLTWSPLKVDPGLPSVACMGSIIKGPVKADGSWDLYASFPSKHGRKDGQIAISRDHGQSWEILTIISGDFAYSALQVSPDQKHLLCLYEIDGYRREQLLTIPFANFASHPAD